SNRRALALVAAAFGPYFVFDLLFQETFTSRYALPLVVPMAFLAVAGMRVLPRRGGVFAAVAIALFDAHVGGTSIAAYSAQKAPAFRLLDDMREAARSTTAVVAMDRRNSLDFRRPLAWDGGARSAGSAATVMIGGRSFDPTLRPRLMATLDGDVVFDKTVAPGAFLDFARIRNDQAHGDYSALTMTAIPPAPVAIEQFDASA